MVALPAMDNEDCWVDAFFLRREKRAGESVGLDGDEDGEHGLIVAQQKKKETTGGMGAAQLWVYREKCIPLFHFGSNLDMWRRRCPEV